MSASASPAKRLTHRDLHAKWTRGEKLAVLTAYDAVTARLLDEAGVDCLLVGDSLGNVVLGFEDTIPVRLDDMIRHAAAVVRGSSRAFVVCDLPFGTALDPESALRASVRCLQETGCQGVKLEGGRAFAPVVRRLVECGIPVMAHVGLTPQFVHGLGGYRRQGKTEEAARELADSAAALAEAGAFALVLECVHAEVAERITASLPIPTIGIGSGRGCSGQVLVVNDLIGLSVREPPSFAKARADAAGLIRRAASEFIAETKGVTPKASREALDETTARGAPPEVQGVLPCPTRDAPR